MKSEKYDLIVIGGGPGGYVAAIKGAQSGMKVLLIEKEELGGVCLNWGCIPTKALLQSVKVLNTIKKAKVFGINVSDYSFDLKKIVSYSRRVSKRLVNGVKFLMKKNKIDVFYGTASFKNKSCVQVVKEEKTMEFEGKNIIVATGSSPKKIPGIAPDGNRIIGSREAMTMKQLPNTVAIIGAGAIGVEFSYFFNSLGVKVHLIEIMPQILPASDTEIAEELALSLTKKGIKIHTNSVVKKCSYSGDALNITFSKKEADTEEEVKVDYLMVAAGVLGNTQNLNLDSIGIEVENSFIKVNENLQTSVENIYAIGDVTGPPMLAHRASFQGIQAINHITGRPVQKISAENVPSCIYTSPEVASIGLTEKEATEKFGSVKIGKFPLIANGKALATGEYDGFAKVIFDKDSKKLIGAHLIGNGSTELIANFSLAKALLLDNESILKAIFPHPTISEVISEAVEDAFFGAIHK